MIPKPSCTYLQFLTLKKKKHVFGKNVRRTTYLVVVADLTFTLFFIFIDLPAIIMCKTSYLR